MPRHAESFVEAVLEVVADIPPGRVMTYGQIAAELGSRGARVVGQVMALYGSDVPWWRVIRASGEPPAEHEERALEHYLEERTPLRGLTTEQASRTAVTGRYRIDLAAARWSPPPLPAATSGHSNVST
ncbi:MGMT family protein [Humibacter sp. RRB41]|uniref:MGMT family protein n=1 Tax=Humibacter sp. RRB41 TaxID=2919946 RepID=UPI001FAB0FDC|nr:MGMT family protein [Humibacter sp. RRB41]